MKAAHWISCTAIIAASQLGCSPDSGLDNDGVTTSNGGSGATGGSGGNSGGEGGNSNVCAETCGGATPICDSLTGQCVACNAGNSDACPDGTLCDESAKECVECLEDTDCGAGAICGDDGTCAVGCSEDSPCSNGLGCCGDLCVDTQNTVEHCGGCGSPCSDLANADETCSMGLCSMGACDDGFADCNLDPNDGCEWDVNADGPCTCMPGETITCYTGPMGTSGVGTCTSGLATCGDSGLGFGPCIGQVVPTFDSCNSGLNEDCVGGVDDPPDLDGDGWTPCDNDCCETLVDCGNPELVNPGAFEVAGNTVDDDCDGTVDNPVALCDSVLPSNSANGIQYAQAMDICQTTTENPATQAGLTWGVISGQFFRANGAGTPNANQRSIRSGFGSGTSPQLGARLAVLSTGTSAAQAAPNNASPAWATFQGGQNMGTTSPVPADWLTANGNNFPNAPGCPDPQGGTTANDPVMLKLRIRVPTNANSFSVNTNFYSSEYPEWVCSAFNDFFLVLLNSNYSGTPANPADKNLAFYQSGASTFPVGVNLAYGAAGLFRQCVNGPTGCGSGAIAGTTSSCTSTAGIIGTGFDILNPPSQFPSDPGWCGTSNRAGGGTGWLVTSGNVTPGETIELRFVTWDTGDPWYDSSVLLDNFTWSVNGSTPGTGEN